VRLISGPERSKGKVCGRLLAGIAGSNPAGGMDVCMSVTCECCVLSGMRPIPCPEEFYRVCCVIMCDLEQSAMRQAWSALGCFAREKKPRVTL
jgi:hypothetical protein